MRIIDRVVAALGAVTSDIMIASGHADASAWVPDVRAVPDLLQGGGAAAGIHAALRASATPILAVGWDMPFVTPALLRAIMTGAQHAAVDAVVPPGRDHGTLEPLCAWYSHGVCDVIESRWDSGARGLHDLLRQVRTYIVPGDVVATVGQPERLFFNVNTPADLAAARAMAEEQ
jgi:molybdopterin-guanine dinucleotide biosynthesis protein A